jgi:hypothetical protein
LYEKGRIFKVRPFSLGEWRVLLIHTLHGIYIMHRNIYVVTSLVVGILISVASYAEVYKTVDKNGRITYTDVPPENTTAKPVELKSINSIPAPPVVPMEATPSPTPTPIEYSVEILAPENGKTLMANERSVEISVAVNQGLQNGHKLAYKLDGNTIHTSIETTHIFVEPPRGEHVLTVDVVNADGKSLVQSKPITLLVMRPFVKQNVAPVPKK